MSEQVKGKIKVQSENIFPIIKKWLYSDHDIFAREMVSNACDAITKYSKLCATGEIKPEKEETFRVDIGVSAKKKYITFSDNGIGMTMQELDKYINEVAFSGAEEFLSNYKGDGAGIIGHFGLGFYSAFMVADKVTIDSKSYSDAPAVKWSCDGSVDVVMEEGARSDRGTTITLFAAADSKKFYNISELRSVLNKYCAYLPYEIYLKDDDKKEEPVKINKFPLWTKAPRECTDEEYKEFYRDMFMDFREPLFWIHLNVDYPFNLKGILYFPEIDMRNSRNEGAIKLFNNQVYVADNIKDVIPEYLMLLRGVIDCPDMPLNVSRSFLQNDGYLTKIKTHITKKVSEKLKNIHKNDYESYKKYWKTINPFVKYGCMTDKDFYTKIKEAVIMQKTDGEFLPLEDAIKDKTVYYVNELEGMETYLKNFEGKTVLIMDDMIDTHFMQFLEGEVSGLKFVRVDSDLDSFKSEGETGELADKEKTEAEWKRVLEGVNMEAGALKIDLPCIIITGENARRMEAMGRIYGMETGAFKDEKLVINLADPVVKSLAAEPDDDKIKLLYNLARLAAGTLPAGETDGLVRSVIKHI